MHPPVLHPREDWSLAWSRITLGSQHFIPRQPEQELADISAQQHPQLPGEQARQHPRCPNKGPSAAELTRRPQVPAGPQGGGLSSLLQEDTIPQT